MPGQSQHVPLDRYYENLKLLCCHPSVIAHDPKIILVTPPPVNEYQLAIRDALKGYTGPQRTAANTKRYADACCQVAEEFNWPVVNVWHAFMSKAGWQDGDPLIGSRDREENEALAELLLDGTCSCVLVSDVDNAIQGLHLSPAGYRVIYKEVMQVIKDQIPDQYPENLPSVYPPWEQAPA